MRMIFNVFRLVETPRVRTDTLRKDRMRSKYECELQELLDKHKGVFRNELPGEAANPQDGRSRHRDRRKSASTEETFVSVIASGVGCGQGLYHKPA